MLCWLCFVYRLTYCVGFFVSVDEMLRFRYEWKIYVPTDSVTRSGNLGRFAVFTIYDFIGTLVCGLFVRSDWNEWHMEENKKQEKLLFFGEEDRLEYC